MILTDGVWRLWREARLLAALHRGVRRRQLNKVVVPITFGPALLNPYHGFAQYTVVGGDTLSGIAEKYYNDANRWPRIFEANRHQIQDPDRIFPGQVLRIPQ